MCVFCQIDLRDDPKTLARLLYMKEKPLTYEHGVKLAKAVGSGLNFVLNVRREGFAVRFGRHALRRLLLLKCTVFRTSSRLLLLPLCSSQARRDRLVGVLVSRPYLFFIKGRNLVNFKQLRHLACDLATSRISICRI